MAFPPTGIPPVNAVAGPSTQPMLGPTSSGSFAVPAPPGQRALKTVSATPAARYPQRERRRAALSGNVIGDLSQGITTRGSIAPKQGSFKIKINPNVANKAGLFKLLMGGYDRCLDEDPKDPIMFEEQFVLRVPESVADGDAAAGIKGLAELVNAKRDIPGVSLKFKDQRRATFTHGGKMYSAKLVDLPTIIEGQKTLDKKRLFKVADICQMLVVEDQINSEQDLKPPTGDPDEYLWPHGLTPPLQHVRKRRFRKREVRLDPVGDAVEKLLQADADAVETTFALRIGFPPTHQRSGASSRGNGSEAGDPNDEDTKYIPGDASAPGTPYDGAATPAGDDFDDGRSVAATEADDGDRALEDMLNGANVDDDDDDMANRRDSDGDEDDEDNDDEDLFGDKELRGDDDDDEDEAEEDVDEELHGWKASLRMVDDELKDTRYAMERKRSSLTNPLLAARDKQLQDLVSRVTRFERERGELVNKIEARQAIRDAAVLALKEQRAAEQAARNAKIAQEAAETAGQAGRPAASSTGTAGRAGASNVGTVRDQKMEENDEDAEGEDEDDDDLFGEGEEEDVDMDAGPGAPAVRQASPSSSDDSSSAEPLAQRAEDVPGPQAPKSPSAVAPASAQVPAQKDWGFELDEDEEEY